MKRSAVKTIGSLLCLIFAGICADAQSRHSVRGGDVEGSILSVTAWRTDKKTDPLKPENFFLYENGIEQKIKGFSYDPSPAKIVLLVDNSQTLPADVEKLKKATMEFAYEIFDGDQLFVVAYDEKPEIIQEWTDEPRKWKRRCLRFARKAILTVRCLEATVNEILLPLMPAPQDCGRCHRRRTRPRQHRNL